MSERMENMEQTVKETANKMEKQPEEVIQRKPMEDDLAKAITHAVEQVMSRAITDARPHRSQDRREHSTVQTQSGARYVGSNVSMNPGPHAVALIGHR